MTVYNKSTLQALFQQGDIPTGTNYSDFIDSNVNLAETAIQNMAGPLSTTKLVTPLVSATNLAIGGNFAINGDVQVAGQSTFVGTANFDGFLEVNSSAQFNGDALFIGNNYYFAATVSADKFSTDGIVSAQGGFYGRVGIVSAAGTTQGAATTITRFINHGKGVADGTATGFAIPANRTGFVQYLFNEGASANLWPPTGGRINGLAANAPLSLAASAMVTIIHLAASAYAVK